MQKLVLIHVAWNSISQNAPHAQVLSLFPISVDMYIGIEPTQ